MAARSRRCAGDCGASRHHADLSSRHRWGRSGRRRARLPPGSPGHRRPPHRMSNRFPAGVPRRGDDAWRHRCLRPDGVTDGVRPPSTHRLRHSQAVPESAAARQRGARWVRPALGLAAGHARDARGRGVTLPDVSLHSRWPRRRPSPRRSARHRSPVRLSRRNARGVGRLRGGRRRPGLDRQTARSVSTWSGARSQHPLRSAGTVRFGCSSEVATLR